MRDIELGTLEAACHPPHSVMLAGLGCFVLCVLVLRSTGVSVTGVYRAKPCLW